MLVHVDSFRNESAIAAIARACSLASRPIKKWTCGSGSLLRAVTAPADSSGCVNSENAMVSFGNNGVASVSPKCSSHVPIQASSRSRASSRGFFRRTVARRERRTVARNNGQRGQCAPSKSLTKRSPNSIAASLAVSTKNRSASWTRAKPDSRIRVSNVVASSRKIGGSSSLNSHPAARS